MRGFLSLGLVVVFLTFRQNRLMMSLKILPNLLDACTPTHHLPLPKSYHLLHTLHELFP